MTAHGRITQPSSMDAPGNLPVHAAPAKVGMGYRRAGFTLVELLITVSVIAIMATMVLFALFAAQETAKVQKTKSLIAKLDSIIKAKYETYKARRVAVNTAGMQPPLAARARLDCLHDLMRMEMPDRWSDIEDPVKLFNYGPPFNNVGVSRPSLHRGYKRKYDAIVTRTSPPPPSPADVGANAGAECLYMIIMQAQGEEADDKSAIKQDQIGDVDGDGFSEIIDAWGRPIKFLRWAPGFVSDLQIAAVLLPSTASSGSSVDSQSNQLSRAPGSYVGGALIAEDPLPANAGRFLATDMAKITAYNYTAGTGRFDFSGGPFSVTPPQRFYVMAADPFDPRGVYPNTAFPTPTFALYPLIYSSGPDKCYGICPDFADMTPFRYRDVNDNPFHVAADGVDGQQRMIGAPRDEPGELNFVTRAWVDNIHNHMITAR